jgi:hypothetical protein
MIFLLFVLQSTVKAQLDAGENIAYDLFNYSKNENDLTGGVGWFSSARWSRRNCEVVDFSESVQPKPNFISFGNTSLVGIRSDMRTIACTLSRQVNDPVISTDRFVSVLFSITPTMRSPAFVVAIGDLDVKKEFKAGGGGIQLTLVDGELGGPGKAHVAMYGTRDVSTRVVHEFVAETSNGTRSFASVTTPHAEVVGYFVCFKFEADSRARMFQRVRARVFPIPVSGASNVSESGLFSALAFNTSFQSPWTISIGLKEIFTSQVRVGTTFESVYTDVPRLPSTPMPTSSSSSNAAQLSTTTTTTTTTQQQTLTSSLTSTLSQSESISDSTTTMTFSCGQIATCAGCLSSNNKCQWCAQWRNNTMGQCVAIIDDECLITARTTGACSGETTAGNDSVTADVADSAAIIGGAVGGSIAALLLVVMVVYLVVRARRGKPRAANTEMVTARDESSAANRTSSNVYGELRLSNEYSQFPPTPEHYSVFPAPDHH